MFRLDKKVALVTGGSTGIGLEAARSFGLAGAKIAIASLGQEPLAKAEEALRVEGIESVPYEMDVTDKPSVECCVEQVIHDFGQIDILMNCAGLNIRKPLLEIEEMDFDKVVHTNLKGTFLVSQAVIKKAMLPKQSGRIINVSSLFGVDGGVFQTSYAASKGGVNQMTKVWAAEFGESGINVNAIAPGYIQTPLTEKWLQDQERRKSLTDKTMLKRLGTVEDLSGPIVFLAAEASKYMTGQTVYVDGGWTAQ